MSGYQSSPLISRCFLAEAIALARREICQRRDVLEMIFPRRWDTCRWSLVYVGMFSVIWMDHDGYILYYIYIFKIEWYVNVTMVCKVVQLQFLMAMIFAPILARWDDEFAMNGDPAASAARCITHHNSSGRIHGQLQSPTPIEPWWPSVFR